MGVVAHRDGHFELIVSKADDLDSCVASLPLTGDEAGALANLLGAPQLVSQLAEQQRDVTGVHTEQLPLVAGSPYDGRTLADTAMRTRTGTSIVAVVRAGTVHPSPRPDFRFEAGDLVVIVGTADGITASSEILERG